MKWKPLWLLFLIPCLYHYELFFLGQSVFARSPEYVGACSNLLAPQVGADEGLSFAVSDPLTSSIYNEPITFLTQKAIRRWELPLWENNIGLGASLFGNGQAGSLFLSVLLITGLLLIATTGEAHAYIDPGSGSFIIQMLLATLFASLFAIKMFWQRVTTQISKISSKISRKNSAGKS